MPGIFPKTKVHAISDEPCRPLSFLLTPGPAVDIAGAVIFGATLANARYLLGDKAYDADHWRGYLKSRRIQPDIPNRSSPKKLHPFDKAPNKEQNVIERTFERLKDFRRLTTRYDKNTENFLATPCLAARIG